MSRQVLMSCDLEIAMSGVKSTEALVGYRKLLSKTLDLYPCRAYFVSFFPSYMNSFLVSSPPSTSSPTGALCKVSVREKEELASSLISMFAVPEVAHCPWGWRCQFQNGKGPRQQGTLGSVLETNPEKTERIIML